jgi:prefoldin beta subunit
MDQEKLQKMQFLEQNLQAVYMQKQTFQMEISETLSALGELEKTEEAVYKIVGQLMIKADKEKMIEELKEKEKLLKTRADSLQKQEEKLSDEVKKLRDELVASQK